MFTAMKYIPSCYFQYKSLSSQSSFHLGRSDTTGIRVVGPIPYRGETLQTDGNLKR